MWNKVILRGQVSINYIFLVLVSSNNHIDFWILWSVIFLQITTQTTNKCREICIILMSFVFPKRKVLLFSGLLPEKSLFSLMWCNKRVIFTHQSVEIMQVLQQWGNPCPSFNLQSSCRRGWAQWRCSSVRNLSDINQRCAAVAVLYELRPPCSWGHVMPLLLSGFTYTLQPTPHRLALWCLLQKRLLSQSGLSSPPPPGWSRGRIQIGLIRVFGVTFFRQTSVSAVCF